MSNSVRPGSIRTARRSLLASFLLGFSLILLINLFLATVLTLSQARSAVTAELRYQLNSASERAIADYQLRQLTNLSNAQWTSNANVQQNSLAGIRIAVYQPPGGTTAYNPSVGWSDAAAADLIGSRADQVLAGQRTFWLAGNLACLAVPVRIQQGQMAILLLSLPRGSPMALFRTYGQPALLTLLAVSLPTLLLAFLAFRRFTRPVTQMVNLAGAVARGDYRQQAMKAGTVEIDTLGEALDKMSRQLEAAEQARKLTLSGLSHELRTPLTTIKANTQAMIDGIIPADEQAEVLADTASEIDRLRGLVDNLLLAANPSAEWPLHRRTANLSDLVRRVMRQMQIRAEAAGMTLAADLPDDLPATVDGSQIRQLITNVLDNAIRYSPAGSSIQVRLQRQDNRCLLEVCNPGPGIPPDLLPRVFEPMVKGPQSSGSGLGLYLCRRIAEAHQGQISLQSDAAAGTCVTVELPTENGPRPGQTDDLTAGSLDS